jgi:hypothetical protein
MKEYTYHIDAGHGYLEVPLADVLRLGLTLKDFAHYSFARVTELFVPTLYLEEDCHMSMFLGAMESKGEQFKLIEIVHDGDAPCREYGRIEG